MNATFWVTWSKLHKTDNPEDVKIAQLEKCLLCGIPSKLLQQPENYNNCTLPKFQQQLAKYIWLSRAASNTR